MTCTFSIEFRLCRNQLSFIWIWWRSKN